MKQLQAYKNDIKRIVWYVLFGIAPQAYIFLDGSIGYVVASGITFCFILFILFKRY